MTNVTIAIKNSVVMLLSFALIATILTITNVGVNESGNTSLSTVQKAEAFSISYDVVGVSPPTSMPSCTSNCSPAKGTGSGGGGGVGVGGPIDPNVRNVYYACSSVSSSGVCTINSVVQRDSQAYTKYCTYRMSYNGRDVAWSGAQAVSYLKTYLIGDWWKSWGSEERMFRHLTGRDLGWLPYPVGWSDIRNVYYNGTTAPQTEGPLRFYCKENIRGTGYSYATASATCAPKNDGRPFPYAVGYAVSYRNYDTNVTTGNNAAYGAWNNWTGRLQHRDWRITGQNCIYVSPTTPPPKRLEKTDTCFWNLSHRGYYSQNKAAILSGGTLTSQQPVYKGAPNYAPWIQGANSTAVLRDCTPQLSMNVSLSLNDGYAYYRLQGSANVRQYQTYVWDYAYTGGRRLVADIVAGPISTQTLKAFGTHACTNPAYNNYPSWGALPNLNFSYADCNRNKTWQCIIPHNPRINGVDNAVEVMRDGNYLPTYLGGVNISGGGVRDSSTKQIGTVVDGNLSYMVQVVSGSSPFKPGTSANDSKQYFELWKGDQKTETQWGTWLSNPNANKVSYLTYYWSSDNGGSWRMTYQAKINTAEFAVPFQNTTDGPSGTAWKTQTNVDCNGVKTSNAATVLRSVNSQG